MAEVLVLLDVPLLLLALLLLSLEPHAHRHTEPSIENGDHELPLDSELLNDALPLGPDPFNGASCKSLKLVLNTPSNEQLLQIIRTVNMSVALGTKFNCFNVFEYSCGKKT